VFLVQMLVQKLSARGRETWIDWQGLPPTVDWMEEIHRAIESANTFVLVISPHSMSSKVCQAEAEYAASLDKRIVPVVHQDAPSGMIPPEIAARNWVFFRREDDPDGAFDALNRALDLDVGWLRFHTRLLMRAKEWSAHDADDSYLLAGTDLNEVQDWLGRATTASLESTRSRPHMSPPARTETSSGIVGRYAAFTSRAWRSGCFNPGSLTPSPSMRSPSPA
jgi:hypothetical protein